jgi:hexosaminidase
MGEVWSRKMLLHLSLNTKPNTVLGNEGYTLNAGIKQASILHANKPTGLVLRHTNTAAITAAICRRYARKSLANWTRCPLLTITDYPRFGWRGLMLDVSRHFFPKETVKRLHRPDG